MVSDKKKFIHSLIFPTLFLLVIWTVKITEIITDISFAGYGVYPLKAKGLIGILLAPLIHGNLNHILANTTPIFVLMTAVFYFYSRVAYKVFFISYIVSGFWVWVSARPAYHIGASGLVYAFAAFIVVTGIIKNNKNLMALSLAILFIYGSMIWGILPNEPHISWESHLMGMISGILLALYYKNEPLSWIHKIHVFKFKEYNNGNYLKISDLVEVNYEFKEKKRDA